MITQQQLTAPRDRGEPDECDDKHHRRRKNEERLIDRAGDHVLFENELEPVGDRLQKTGRPNAVGSAAILRPRGDLSLEVNAVGYDALNRANGDHGQHDTYAELTRQKLNHDPLRFFVIRP